jgi:hypothetical protein
MPWNLPRKPLDILKKGLESLRNDVKTKRDRLLAQLAEKKPITSSDEHWLDNDANLVDEEWILEALEKASNYERGVERLDDKGKAIMMKLRELAGDLLPKTSKKRKCESHHLPCYVCPPRLTKPKMLNRKQQPRPGPNTHRRSKRKMRH